MPNFLGGALKYLGPIYGISGWILTRLIIRQRCSGPLFLDLPGGGLVLKQFKEYINKERRINVYINKRRESDNSKTPPHPTRRCIYLVGNKYERFSAPRQ